MYETSSRQDCPRYCHVVKATAVIAGALLMLATTYTGSVQAETPEISHASSMGEALKRQSITACVHQSGCPLYDNCETYSSIEDAVKDTIPGEWWPPNGYGYTMYNGALKSASIIIRTRVKYHTEHAWSGWPQGRYPTTNIDWPNPDIPPEDFPSPQQCPETAMNTILPGQPGDTQGDGGSRWGDDDGHPRHPNYKSNLAADRTNGLVVVNDASQAIFAEWNGSVETRTVQCNYYSRDWTYCAKNALAELPGYANHTARRVSNEYTNRFWFQAEAFNSRVSRYHSCGLSYWFWSNYSPDGDGSDGSTWHPTHFMKAEPNNGCGFGSSENYQTNSPYMTYKVPFPQSGTWYVWIRGKGGSVNDDSVHASLDGPGGNALDMSGWQTNTWQWSNTRQSGGRATVSVSGNPFHTLYVWMREDGMRVDEILLTTDPTYTPSG